MLNFFNLLPDIHLIDLDPRLTYDLNHWFEAVNIEELLVELTINNCEGKRTTFHDLYAVNLVTGRTLFQGCYFLLDFQDLTVKALYVVS